MYGGSSCPVRDEFLLDTVVGARIITARIVMFRFQLTVVFIYLVYFFTFLTGRPGFEPVPPLYQELNGEENSFEPDSGAGPALTIRGGAETRMMSPPVFVWKAGLIQRVAMQRQALELFTDNLLESDSRPDQLFRSMERTLTGDIFLLCLTGFWCFLILLCGVAAIKRHWFFASMFYLIMIPSVLLIFLILITVRRDTMSRRLPVPVSPRNHD